MDGKTVLVTGATSDIGKVICEFMALKGANIVINYLNNLEEAEKLAEKLQTNYHVDIIKINCDVRNEEEVKKMMEAIEMRFGHLDVIINNAATYQDEDMMEKSAEEFLNVLNVNVVGPFLVSKHGSKIMDNGFIINISSTDASTTYSELSMDYSASKAALENLTKTLALRLQNIKVNAIAPNWVDTSSTREMNPVYLNSELVRVGQQRLLNPLDIAKMIHKVIIDDDIFTGEIITMEDKLDD